MKAIKQFKVAAIIAITLGIIHICATPIIIPALHPLGFRNELVFIYMFIFTGAALVFIGWIQYFVLKRWNQDNTLLTILKVSVMLISISGIGAVATMWYNPFAYIILFVALYQTVLLIYATKI